MPAVPSAVTKDVAHVKELAEDVTQIGESRAVEPGSRGIADTCMAEAVIHRPLLTVGEHGICLAALLKLLFGVRIIGIAVGMILQGELAVGALDLHVGRRTLHA